MTFTEFYQGYLKFIWDMLMYDINVLSNPWMYWPFLIPAIGYLIFVIFKWTIIFLPIVYPIVAIVRGRSGVSTIVEGISNSAIKIKTRLQ